MIIVWPEMSLTEASKTLARKEKESLVAIRQNSGNKQDCIWQSLVVGNSRTDQINSIELAVEFGICSLEELHDISGGVE